ADPNHEGFNFPPLSRSLLILTLRSLVGREGVNATGFYPLEIEVQWLKNGQLEEEGVAFREELQNGDWTYQLQVMLETQPQRGYVYTCQVGHASPPSFFTWNFCREGGGGPSLD
uniref:Ig-like domain-containing protein n=1 Tax=Naja naja TaxID=35670 RepID=A0A8C6VEF9_NAJNA